MAVQGKVPRLPMHPSKLVPTTFACSRWARTASRASPGPLSRKSWSTSQAEHYDDAKAVEEQRLRRIHCRQGASCEHDAGDLRDWTRPPTRGRAFVVVPASRGRLAWLRVALYLMIARALRRIADSS